MLSILNKIFGISGDDKVIEKSAILVDVRSVGEFRSGHLVNAVNIPLEIIEQKTKDLATYPQVVVYCRSGNRSAHARKLLMESGVQNVVDAGSLASAQKLLEASGSQDTEIVTEVVEHKLSIDTDNLKDTTVMKILIPTDFSVQADFSYLMAAKLEEHFTTEIHFLHIINAPDTVTMDDSGNIETCGEIDIEYLKAQKLIADQKLQQLKKLYGEDIHTDTVLGKLTDSIVTYAKDHHFDLVVMGTKGAWGLQERMSPTQAQLIARKSEVPLLSLMCDRSDLQIKDVMFVHDFMEDDDSDIPLMHKFSEFYHVNYHFVQIYKHGVSIDKDSVYASMDKYAAAHGIEKHQNHLVEAIDVESGVKTFLASQDADMVFIGTHGKGGFFHKSAAESIIKHLFKPIISFHINSK